jgi:endonuclease G
MRGLLRRSWLRLASTLAGGALIAVLALTDGLWPGAGSRPTSMPPPPPAAATGGCAEFHPSGQRPEILRPGLGRQARLLCNEAFEVLHSGVARVPIWSAQRLDAAALSAARAVAREDAFRADARLPPGERAEPADYARSGFDRGHMAPAADMPSVSAQAESFLLSNMVPQVPAHNRGLWARIEAATRGLAARTGRLYVLTGIASLEERPAFVGGRVLVPSHVFKAVFDPGSGGAGVWWSPNTAAEAYEVISLDELEARTGLRIFPTVAGPARARAMDLPSPRPRSSR